jgi:hypothetical protein
VHVRKVREVETGGEQTPYDSPIYFEMNSSNTGFNPIIGPKLFKPLAYEFVQETFNLNVEPGIAGPDIF